MRRQQAFQKWPLLSLLQLTRPKGWKAWLRGRPEEARTGGADTVRDSGDALGASEKDLLLELAREALEHLAEPEAIPGSVAKVTSRLKEKRACFITLTRKGELRGCIGQVFAKAPLYQAVIDNARGAARRDPRFAPVEAGEVAELNIEISVLTEPQRVNFASADDLLSKLQPFHDGVVLQLGSDLATFLPQVWSQVPDKSEFLGRLAQKAGYPPTAWQDKDAVVSTYRVESFGEN